MIKYYKLYPTIYFDLFNLLLLQFNIIKKMKYVMVYSFTTA
jgi:hypothetical protein